MKLKETKIPGCYEIECNVFSDCRGLFVKTYHLSLFKEFGLRSDWKEEYYSVSNRGVLRGMHFQTPPEDHAKMVFCVSGKVFDVVVDLRIGSPAYGQCQYFILSQELGNSIYIPSGLAHGFLSITDRSVVQYKVTSVHSPKHDDGILWDSLDLEWPCSSPVISERDKHHYPLSEFVSPFTYKEGV